MDLSTIGIDRPQAHRLGRRWLLVADLVGAAVGCAVAGALLLLLVA